jgi:hypothetical protein
MSKFLPVDVIDTLKHYGVKNLDEIPKVLEENRQFVAQFPEATKWLGQFYRRMKTHIRREFEK